MIGVSRSTPAVHAVRRTAAVALALAMVAACDAPGTSERPPTPPPAERVGGEATGSVAPGAPDSIVDGEHATSGNVAVRLYFFTGEETTEVERAVRPSTDLFSAEDTLRVAIEALIAGPTADERADGMSSFFSDETRQSVRLVRIDGLHAVIDFHDFSHLIPNASSSLGSTMLLAALNSTVFANSRVASVEYRFDGSCDAFGEWVQRGCIRYERDR